MIRIDICDTQVSPLDYDCENLTFHSNNSNIYDLPCVSHLGTDKFYDVEDQGIYNYQDIPLQNTVSAKVSSIVTNVKNITTPMIPVLKNVCMYPLSGTFEKISSSNSNSNNSNSFLDPT
mgnify:CR=1 FL=1|tara:strand:+ start:1343 stop:1699 length:357 start_codon:yes stop_codon:yes gene_type:complete